MQSDMHTPVSVFLKLHYKTGGKFIFESVEKGENVGRYSIIGFDPTSKTEASDRDLLDEVQRDVADRTIANELPFPFCGGAVGFVGYESVTFYEENKLGHLRNKPNQFKNIPTSCFLLVDQFIVFD